MNTLFIGKVYLRFDELASTNDYAADWIAGRINATAKNKPPEGAVVRADSQSAGRGQFGSKWESEAGKNLTLSVMLYPVWLEVSAQFYLNMAVTLALLPPETGATAKWPNDIYIGNRKTAGVLIQNSLSGGYLQSAVIGIGMNVNQEVFHSDAPNPTSLALATGRRFDLDQVAAGFFERLENRYLQLKAGKRSAILEEYTASLYRINEPAMYRRTASGEAFSGIIRGVTAAGRLRMETEKGEETFDLKGIRFV
jgi:BirA family biotin operon repressor/biotin-[acetyl-CoA-carboxylase] ligase